MCVEPPAFSSMRIIPKLFLRVKVRGKRQITLQGALRCRIVGLILIYGCNALHFLVRKLKVEDVNVGTDVIRVFEPGMTTS